MWNHGMYSPSERLIVDNHGPSKTNDRPLVRVFILEKPFSPCGMTSADNRQKITFVRLVTRLVVRLEGYMAFPQGSGGLRERNKAWDREKMFSQLAKRSASKSASQWFLERAGTLFRDD